MSKSSDALNYVKLAEKCLKTSFLKWSADIDGAIENYIKAAECYKSSRDYENSISLYLKVSDMQEKNDALFYSAKSIEEAANICRELKNYSRMSQLIMKAGQNYRINGSADTATQLMQRMARSIEDEAPEESAKLYVLACQAAQDKDNLRDASEFSGLAAKLFVRANNFESAKDALNSKLHLLTLLGDFHEAGKAVVCLVLLDLNNNDFVGASKVYSNAVESNSFTTTQDCGPVNQLLNAIDQNEYNDARSILRGHTFLYLENDFVKLARGIKFPESTVTDKCDGDGCDEDDIN